MTSVFVYGTLKPGHSRWPALVEFTTGEPVADSIDGTLYDTGWSWPVATVGGEGVVPGFSVPIQDSVLQLLDTIEGVPDLFERRLVTTHSGIQAWVYHWPNTTKTFTKMEVW